MSYNARKELVLSVALRYHKVDRNAKMKILDEFTAATGYHRKYAILLLRQFKPVQKAKAIPKKPANNIKYDEEVQKVLIQIWEASNRICSKRLVPYLPELVEVLTRHNHLKLSSHVRSRLLSISPATVDRILAKSRSSERIRGLSTTRSGFLLKRKIPIRTFFDWKETEPGFIEADLVAHCGTSVQGSYVHTLVMTDIATGWTEPTPIPYRDQEMALSAIKATRQRFPFALKGLDTDNGTEFLNHSLINYCRDEQVTFTRSRAYKKNDQCHVEQKNCQVVRRFVGYDRFEGLESCRRFADLYKWIRLYVNFFQPSMKLIRKQRDGSKVSKTYDKAKTPYQRIQESPEISDQVKKELKQQYKSLDPVKLLMQIAEKQDLLWQRAWISSAADALDNQSNGKQSSNQNVVQNGDSIYHTVPKSSRNGSNTHKELSSLDNTNRIYRNNKRSGKYHLVKHSWVTRPDPFKDIKDEIINAFQLNPNLDAKSLFQTIQMKYPGRFKNGQLRTLQRRIKELRMEQIKKITEEIGIILEPESY